MQRSSVPILSLVVLVVSLSGLSPAQSTPEARTALVFGVGNYADRYFTELKAPETDAKAMAEKLQALGFDVTLKLNATRREMLDATDAFGTALAERKGVGLFYFSGHGSIKPDEADPNFLIPAGSAISSREDLPQEAFNVQRVANRMKDAGNRLNLIFLDACRNNSLPSRSKEAAGGLAAMRGASGLMFFFATQPNQIALEDSENKRSLFTHALLKHIQTPGLSFMDMMADVTAETEQLSTEDGSDFKQSPYMSGTLSGRFVFATASPSPSPASTTNEVADMAKQGMVRPTVGNTGTPVSTSEQNSESQMSLAQLIESATIKESSAAQPRPARAKSAVNAPVSFTLWPQGAPEPPGFVPEAEKTLPNQGSSNPILRVANVSAPTLTIYRPDKPNGTSVIICPGGGYGIVAMGHEGTEVCEGLSAAGVTCALLKYRVPKRDPDDPSKYPLQDLQRAIGLVRHHADEWGIRRDRVGVLGFSAGAYLVALNTLHPDERTYAQDPELDVADVRPSFAILAYPAYLVASSSDLEHLNPRIVVTAEAPPVCLLHASDDNRGTTSVNGSALLYREYRRLGRPAKLLIYEKGGHGFGMRQTGMRHASWLADVMEWMDQMGWMTPAAQ